ncbi:hypothetical protein N7494_004449 [Penicillium frequentans]|uniref:Uncharacterized protein n=1 Tax=Penicillium frequentans TaxID=3151616 RepID=A0AAD6D1U5_9EURO|nr:hypothetical protein N7494_004449 [Penicillium glabrum]
MSGSPEHANMTEKGLEDAWRELVQGVAALEPFPFESFAQRLQNKVRCCFVNGGLYADVLGAYITKSSKYPEDDRDFENSSMLGYEIHDLFEKLAIPAAAMGVANAGDRCNAKDLKACVSSDNSKHRYLETLTNLMVFCLGEHISFQLKKQGKRGLIELYEIEGFKEHALKEINSPTFINVEIRSDIARDSHLFSISFLMLADFFENRDFVFCSTPSMGLDFKEKASYKALDQWSRTLWMSGGNESAEDMDKIVQFCGRVATIGLVPPNDTTGLQHPAPVSRTMHLFYSMGSEISEDQGYSKSFRDSLYRLQDKKETIDEWKSYCSTLSKVWEINIQSIWNTAFYRALQDGKFDPIKSWAAHSWEAQSIFKWDDYRPVTNAPYDNFSYQLSTVIPSESQVKLVDGTKNPVEAISEKDRVITHGIPKISVPVERQINHKSETTRLVGFNGEKPSIPSSQVFYTPMGLRAADVEAAQKQNPYQRIGTLAIGHIVYRQQGDEYAEVEIKSIEQSEETTFDLPTQTLGEIIETLRNVPGNKRLDLLSHLSELQPILQRFDSQCVNQRLNQELFGRYSSPDGQAPTGKSTGKRLSFDNHIETRGILSSKVGIPVDRLTRRFCLTPDDPNGVPTGYELPDLILVDGYLLPQNGEKLRSRYNPQDRTFQWTRELQDRNEFEHGVFEIYSQGISGTGVVYLSPESEPWNNPARDQVHTFKASAGDLQGQTPRSSPYTSAAADQYEWRSFGGYKITLDRSVWAPDTERSDAKDPVDGGTLEQGAWTSSDGPDIPGLRFPLVDKLRDQINKSSSQPLGDFHKITSQMVEGELEYTIVFSCAPLIPLISDVGPNVKKTFQVGFSSDLGVDVTLPMLYQQMRIKFDDQYNGFTGYLFEYDYRKRGGKGNRHFIKGLSTDSQAVALYRSKASKYYASISNPGGFTSINEKDEPSPVTMSLLDEQEGSLKDLQAFSTYNEKQLHNAAQQFIHKMMLYHMDDTQREKILREPKPLVPLELPCALARDLQRNLKTFFKERYAPAFICRYVGRTPKYLKSFTDKEIKNLWYWWEGSGKKSLSQSVEYNDINVMASRVAMLSTYESKLKVYLDNRPHEWAKKLHDNLINNKRMLRNWASQPLDGGNNLINKQCSILDALDPSSDWGQSFFTEFMAFAAKEGFECPQISEDDDKVYEWVHDSMKDQIIAILKGEGEISDRTRESLMKDIVDFEKANGLNSQKEANDRAAALMEKSALFLRELSGWVSSISKGLHAAFDGTVLFTWFGKAFDKIAAKFALSLKAVAVLKGLTVVLMLAASFAYVAVGIWQLVNNWDTMSGAARSTVIIETARMILDATDHAFDSFKSFKSKPSSTALDEVNTQVLNDSLSETIGQNGKKMGAMAKEIVGEKSDYRVVMGENMKGQSEVPIEGQNTEIWNEDISSPAKEVPPGYEEVPEKLDISGKMLRILNAILGIGLIISMSFSLAHDWNSLTDTGKVLGVLNVIVQGLIVLLDIVTTAADIGLFAITEAMSVALPLLGAVLAVIGMVLMIVQLFVNFYSAQQEPPDPIADFVKDVGHALIATFDPSPEPQLTYSISKTDVRARESTSITITGVNNSPDKVTLSHTKITLYTGNDDVCLFRNTKPYIQLVEDQNSDKGQDGYTYVTTHDISGAQLPEPAKLGNKSDYYQYDLKAAGPPQKFTTSLKNLILEKGQKFQSVWTALVNDKGKDSDSSTSWIEIAEVGLKDKCQQQFTLHRI